MDNVRDRVCLALDVDNLREAKRVVSLVKQYVGIFKIGSHLFTKEGPKSIEAIHRLGGKVFLDLKYHDIPNTVAQSARMATQLGVFMFNIHASGGSEMMIAASDAAEDEASKSGLSKPLILAVTVLTSISQSILSAELNVMKSVEDQVIHFAKLAKKARLSGVVASPKEITAIRKACGKKFIILTPGIRPAWSITNDDQKRVTTPREAISAGADYIVVGRPILKASNPTLAAENLLLEIR